MAQQAADQYMHILYGHSEVQHVSSIVFLYLLSLGSRKVPAITEHGFSEIS